MSRKFGGSASVVRFCFAIAGATFVWAGQSPCVCEAQARVDDTLAQRLIDEVEKTYCHFLPTSIGGRFPSKSRLSRFRGKQFGRKPRP